VVRFTHPTCCVCWSVRHRDHTSPKRKRGNLFGPSLALRAGAAASRVRHEAAFVPGRCRQFGEGLAEEFGLLWGSSSPRSTTTSDGACMPKRTRSPATRTTVTTIESPSRIHSLSRRDSTSIMPPPMRQRGLGLRNLTTGSFGTAHRLPRRTGPGCGRSPKSPYTSQRAGRAGKNRFRTACCPGV